MGLHGKGGAELTVLNNVTRTYIACVLLALVGCGSNDSNLSQSTAFSQGLQQHNDLHQKTLQSLPTGVSGTSSSEITSKQSFPFTASLNFSRVTRGYTFAELTIGAFNLDSDQLGIGQTQLWPAIQRTFSAPNPRINSAFYIDGTHGAFVEDGSVTMLTNDETGDSFSLASLSNRPSGANIVFTSDTSDSTSKSYSGTASFPSGWTAVFTRSDITIDYPNTGGTQTTYKTISFAQPIVSQSRIQISNPSPAHTSTNTTFDFDISTVNATVGGWAVQVEKDNNIVKTFNPTADARGPGTATGSNPLHISLNWDGLADNNQAVTGNITWVMTAKTTTFVPGGNLNDGVKSSQVRLDDNLDPPELSILEGDSETVLASSSPQPYVGSAFDAIAALDESLGGLASNFLDLSKSNDQITLSLPQKIKIRYVVKRTPQIDNLNNIDVTVTTSQTNKTALVRTLQHNRGADSPSNARFEATFNLVSGTAQGTDIGFQNFTNSFTTFDYNSGEGANYEDGNAQDGLEWERHEKSAGGTQLGRAAKLTPSEKASKSYRSTTPPTMIAMRAAGYEDLIVERQSLKAWTRVQNQAHSLYTSTHGLTSGELFTDEGQCPAETVQPTWQNGNLDLVIFAGCSVLDIGNFNGWTNTVTNSPGLKWKGAARPATAGRAGCMFLGYNATAPLGNFNEPAGSLHGDTRILGFYYDQLSQQSNPNSQEAKAMSWLLANAYMEVRIADDACAITDDYYYFIKTKAFNARNKPIEDPHAQSDDGSYTTERTIWKVHKTYWSKLGASGFNSIPLGSTGKTMMRKLPPARMGESGKI